MIPDLFHYYNVLLSQSSPPMELQGKKIKQSNWPTRWGSFSSTDFWDILTTDLHKGQPGRLGGTWREPAQFAPLTLQQCTRVLFSPHPCQHLSLVTAILTSVRWRFPDVEYLFTLAGKFDYLPHLSGIMQYLSCDWPISFSTISSRLIHVDTYCKISFFKVE